VKADRQNRSDISLALLHLTGPRGKLSSLESLISILVEGRIRGSGNDGFVKGPIPAACFTEMPLSAITLLAERSKASKHPYESYGIAMHKSHAFSKGARPVIYLPDRESEWIPETEKWRHVRFEYGAVDFSHEREWRCPGEFVLDGTFGFYVVVATPQCEKTVRDNVPEKQLRPVIGFLHMTPLADFL
jgi:hypothetical protein